MFNYTPIKIHIKEEVIMKRERIRKKDSEKPVRTSFSLSDEAIEELELMTREKMQETGKEKTYKIIFDELLKEGLQNFQKGKIKSTLPDNSDQIRKTFVINQGNLKNLNEKAKELKSQRDNLLQSIILKQKEKRLDKKSRIKIFLKEYSLLCQNIQKINNNLEANLKYDFDYEICDIYDLLTEFASSFKKSIEIYLESDIPIDVPGSIPNAIDDYKNYLEVQITKNKVKEK